MNEMKKHFLRNLKEMLRWKRNNTGLEIEVTALSSNLGKSVEVLGWGDVK